MDCPELQLEPEEQVLYRKWGTLYITAPQDVRVITTFVDGEFTITNRRLSFRQERWDGYSPGFYPPGGVEVDLRREAIRTVEKRGHFFPKLLVLPDTGGLLLSISKWREFQDKLLG